MAEFDSEKVGYSLTIDGKYHNTLDIEGFSHMMKDPSCCYKFYWLEAIVQLISEGISETTFDTVINEMICNAWYIFREAGSAELTKACNAIGGCKTGNAVITPGFKLPAKYVIHAVGPRWIDGNHNEPKLLYSAYKQSLILAKENGLHSIGFPLISAGIFGYPLDEHGEKQSRPAMTLFRKIRNMISGSFLRCWMTRFLLPEKKHLRISLEIDISGRRIDR